MLCCANGKYTQIIYIQKSQEFFKIIQPVSGLFFIIPPQAV